MLLKAHRHKYNRVLKITKVEYYSKQINDESNRINLFRIIHKLLKKKPQTPLPDHSNSEELSNEFVQYLDVKISKICENFACSDSELPFEYYVTHSHSRLEELVLFLKSN